MQTSGQSTHRGKYLSQAESVQMKRAVRRELRVRARMLAEEAYFRFYAKLVVAVGRGEISLERVTEWHPDELKEDG